MKYYKHKDHGGIIDENEYDEYPSSIQDDYTEVEKDRNGDFVSSAAIGFITGSAILGGLLGGDMLGGIVGDILDDGLFD